MQFVIADGSTKEIVVGSQVICKVGYLPVEFDNVAIEIMAIKDGLPHAQLEPSQLSAISPELIEVVL